LAEAISIGQSSIMTQVYDYLNLRTDSFEVSVNILAPNQVALYWRSTGFCVCMGEIVVSDDVTKEVFHNFRREFSAPPKMFPDNVIIFPISPTGAIGGNGAEYNLGKVTATGFAIHRRATTLPTPQADFDRGKEMKRMYIAMGISLANATTSDVPSVIRNYP
jgi:hypothetical protein